MSSNVRFVDSLKVGAYAVDATGGTGIVIDNNVNNYLLTATGENNRINGEPQLQFDGINLGIGGPSAGARFEINDNTGNDLLIIKNDNDQGIKVGSDGVLQLIEFNSLPGTAPEGGLAISANNFYVGL